MIVVFSKLWSFFFHKPTQDLGIDLGTANTLICSSNKGVLLREPSVVAIDYAKVPPELLAVGEEAHNMMGRTPANVRAIRPLREGVIADFEWAEAMLKALIAKVAGQPGAVQSSLGRVVICVPSGVTEVERRAVGDAAFSANARSVNIIDEPMAAAIGAGMPVEKPVGNLIVDIGGGTTEIAVLSLNGMVAGDSLRVAGDQLTEAIQDHVRQEHSLTIGEPTAEHIKMTLGSAYKLDDEEEQEVRGTDTRTGLPATVVVTTSEIRACLMPIVTKIVKAIKDTLAITPPEMASDIMENGLVLAGGGALLQGLDKLLETELEIPVRVANDPLSCVVMGTQKVLSDPAYKKILELTEYDGRY
jgi:rod shape-determining protein MreB and related proteins